MHRAKDEVSRQIIETDLDISMLVEAGAGSGKTTSLIKRMLALLAEGKCSVDTMVAVTFTRKAASELKGKFQIELEKAIHLETDGRKSERYMSALSNLDLLFTGTIHSFCARLLRERPVEVRLDPDFTELEEDENMILRDRCWSEYLESIYIAESGVLSQLAELGIEPAQLAESYQNVCLYPEVQVVRKVMLPPDLARERRLLEHYLRQAWNDMPKAVPEKGWDKLQIVLRRAGRLCRYLDLTVNANFMKVLGILDRSAVVTQNKWSSREVAKAQEEAFRRFREDVVGPCMTYWRQYCHYFIMELIVPAVEYFKQVRERDSLMNYQDLLMRAAGLLRENSEVRRYFQKRFTHIMVDEFQDTDPIQAEIILYLTGDDAEEKSWQDVTVRPGSLFIVGDPKQSIYRFRRADIDTYNEVREVIIRSGGRIIPLTTNFRSVPVVCQWINPIFRGKFPGEATQFQPAFEELMPFSNATGGGIRRITIGKVFRDKQEEAAEADSRRIAAWIKWALAGNIMIERSEEDKKAGKTPLPVPEDFMILLHYKVHLPIYGRALELRGVPYEILGGTGFNRSEEVGQVLRLLAAIAEPDDRVSLIATLRGRFFGVSDDVLYRFKKGGGIFSYLIETRCEDETVRQLMESRFNELHQFHQWARTKPPSTALHLIMDRLGIIPLARTKEAGETRAGNLLKALELAHVASSQGIRSFPDMVAKLTSHYAEAEAEEMPVEPGKTHAVRIMNLHKAKGLEANVVFLADPLKDSDHEPDIHISRVGKDSTGHFVAKVRLGEFKTEIAGLPPDWEKNKATEEMYEKAEQERLLYVATTRARQVLVVSWYPSKLEKGAWTELYPHLGAAEELEEAADEPNVPVNRPITIEEFEAAKIEIVRRIENGQKHSYERQTVTAIAKAEAPSGIPLRGDEAGMSWGRIIHRTLEALLKNERIDLEAVIKTLLEEEGRPADEQQAVLNAIMAVVSSDFWVRVKKSEKRLMEVPFALKKDGPVPEIITGTIDLVFKEAEGWVIVDYKSDGVDSGIDDLIARYRPQVLLYKNSWERITGESVREAGIYFTAGNRWVVV